MKILYLTIAIQVMLCLVSCNSGRQPSEAFDLKKARAFIDSVNAKFSERFRKGDSVALDAYYASDAKMMFPKQEPIEKKDMLAAWGSAIRSAKDMTFTTTDLTGDENFLVETGIYKMIGHKDNVQAQGKYVVIWKKQANGEWKLYRDIGL